jgi:UDP-glucose:(heptosyl)LPS alpha-1,3-glucosyltransferase
MRIALISIRHARTGGTERYLNHLAAHLATMGHTVTIVCRRHEEPPHPAVRFEVLHEFAFGGSHRMWVFAKAVERHMAQTRYDVVCSLGKTWSHDVIWMGGGCYQTYLDLVYTIPRRLLRYIATRRLKSRLALAIEARAFAPGAYSRVITNSEMVKRDVISRYKIPLDKITVIHNGVDLERFHPRHRIGSGAELRQQCGFRPEHVVVVFLGTGYYRKGLDRLLAVFPALLHKRPEARLLVVGYDAGLEYWKSRARRLGLETHVCFLGGRGDPEVCYGAGDLYVLPTRYDPAAFSTLEALASGLPVITTATNGGAEVLVPDVHGAVLQNAEESSFLLQELLQWVDRIRLQQAAQAVRAQAERYSAERELQASTAVLMEVAALKQQRL